MFFYSPLFLTFSRTLWVVTDVEMEVMVVVVGEVEDGFFSPFSVQPTTE